MRAPRRNYGRLAFRLRWLIAIMPAIATKAIPVEVMDKGAGLFMLPNSLGVGVGALFGLLLRRMPLRTIKLRNAG